MIFVFDAVGLIDNKRIRVVSGLEIFYNADNGKPFHVLMLVKLLIRSLIGREIIHCKYDENKAYYDNKIECC